MRCWKTRVLLPASHEGNLEHIVHYIINKYKSYSITSRWCVDNIRQRGENKLWNEKKKSLFLFTSLLRHTTLLQYCDTPTRNSITHSSHLNFLDSPISRPSISEGSRDWYTPILLFFGIGLQMCCRKINCIQINSIFMELDCSSCKRFDYRRRSKWFHYWVPVHIEMPSSAGNLFKNHSNELTSAILNQICRTVKTCWNQPTKCLKLYRSKWSFTPSTGIPKTTFRSSRTLANANYIHPAKYVTILNDIWKETLQFSLPTLTLHECYPRWSYSESFCSELFIIVSIHHTKLGSRILTHSSFYMITQVITCMFYPTEKSGRSCNLRHGCLWRASVERAKTMAEALRTEFVGSWAPSSYEGSI